MTRKICCLMAIAVLTLSLAAAAADTYAANGDGRTTVRFYAQSSGSAKVEFTQTEGQCEELSYTHLIDGILGVEEEWGKYHFYITDPYGRIRVEDWDKTFNGGSFSISLPLSGTYGIRVVPYTAQEMTDSWTLDRFVEWTRQPHWQISNWSRCSISAANPNGNSSGGGTSGGNTSGRGTSGQGGQRSGSGYDMGVPNIGSRVYRGEEMNMAIFWVQTQLKATGSWYQGDQWDCTGRLGDHTMSEIRFFMRSRGYSSHSGQVDQTVINELASFLGGRMVPVYVGGIYDSMNSIMRGGSSGSMDVIYSNLIDMVPHVTTGARWVQTCLKTLGYYNGSVDGMYGEGTDRAVKAFQADYGWERRDYVTLGVARAMLEAYASRGGNLNALP